MISDRLSRFGLVLLAPVACFVAGCIPVAPPMNGDTTPAEFTAANLNRGGALYDKWWNVAGVAEPTTDHALWATRPDTDSNTRTGPDTWRCKECHGWDYKGVNGAYATGSHRTGIAGVFGTTQSPQEVFDLLTNAEGHAFLTTGLADTDIWDLAKFVLEGQIDTDDIIDEQGAFIGVAADGQAPYEAACSACHGTDGLAVPPGGDADFDAFVGVLSNDNPWEYQHKVRYGQPNTAMPPQQGLLTTAQVGDLGAHSQTLPTAP